MGLFGPDLARGSLSSEKSEDPAGLMAMWSSSGSGSGSGSGSKSGSKSGSGSGSNSG